MVTVEDGYSGSGKLGRISFSVISYRFRERLHDLLVSRKTEN